MAFHHSPRIVSRGIAFNLDAINKKCYPGTGTSSTDTVGGNTGTLTNGITYNGKAFDFDGSTERIQYTNFLNDVWTSNTWTVSIWFNASNVDAQYDYILTTGYPIQIAINYSNLKTWISSTTGNDYYVSNFTGLSSVQVDTWYNAVLVNRASNDRQWYINGAPGPTSSNNGTPAASTDGMGGLRIGAWAGGTFPFNGQIGMVQIYDTNLTSEEILQNYNALKGRYE